MYVPHHSQHEIYNPVIKEKNVKKTNNSTKYWQYTVWDCLLGWPPFLQHSTLVETSMCTQMPHNLQCIHPQPRSIRFNLDYRVPLRFIGEYKEKNWVL